MTAREWAWLLLVTVPLWVVVAATALHLLRRPDIGPGRKAVWLAVIVALPALGSAVYLVARPVPLAVDAVAAAPGPGADLARLVDRLDAGDIGRAEFEAALEETVDPALDRRPPPTR